MLKNRRLIGYLVEGNLASVLDVVERGSENVFAELVFNYLRETNDAKLLELSQNYVKEDIKNNGGY